jgi:hypothetical protein
LQHTSSPEIIAWGSRPSYPQSHPAWRDSRESHARDSRASHASHGRISPFAPTEPDWDPATALADIMGEGKGSEAAVESDLSRRLRAEDFATATLFAQPFVIAFVVLRFRTPPTLANWASADPALGLLPRDPTLWLLPLFGLALSIAWLAFAWPSWAVVKRALLTGIFGAALVGVAAAAWWHFRGPLLPTSVRLETAPAQGLCLGLGAGVLEELLIHAIVLPVVYLYLVDRSRGLAVVVAALVAGLAFAALHDSSAIAFSSPHFLVRTLIPGIAISLLALLTRPAFAVVAGCTLHLIAPLCFV